MKSKAKKAQKLSDSPKANFDLTLPEGYEDSSTDSRTSSYKRSPAKVSDVSHMLPNSSSSDTPLKHGSKQALTHSKGATEVMIDYPENEVIPLKIINISSSPPSSPSQPQTGFTSVQIRQLICTLSLI